MNTKRDDICPKCGVAWTVHDGGYCGSELEKRHQQIRARIMERINKLVDHVRPDVWHAGGR